MQRLSLDLPLDRRGLTHEQQAKISRARDLLLVFLAYPGRVEPANDGSERLLCPAVVQREVTDGYHAMWAAEGEADIRTAVDTARLAVAGPFATILDIVRACTPTHITDMGNYANCIRA